MVAIKDSGQFDNYVTQIGGIGGLGYRWPTFTCNIEGLADNPAQKDAALRAMNAWSAFTGVKFQITTSRFADITIDNELSDAYCTNNPDGTSFINVDKAWENSATYTPWAVGSYGLQTMIHEIGHALGLSHGGPYDASWGAPTYALNRIFDIDTWQYSVMSYFDQSSYTRNKATSLYLMAPMIADIEAIRKIYGPISVNEGNTTYGRGERCYGGLTDVAVNPDATYCINDTGGNDTVDYGNAWKTCIISLKAGSFSDINGDVGNVSISPSTVIENASGGYANDILTGNDIANVLRGNQGADQLYGNEGNDTLLGGSGGDLLNGGAGTDTASYADSAFGVTANLASPWLNAGDARGDTYASIENLTGSSAADVLTGDKFANTLQGLSGDDRLYGNGGDDILKGGEGVNILSGGWGNDTLMGGAGRFSGKTWLGDRFEGQGGSDTVSYEEAKAGLIVSLSAPTTNTGEARGDRFFQIENLTGTGFNDTVSGDAGQNVLRGGAGNDKLFGLAGNDTLAGGPGSDTLTGGSGQDRFCLDAYRFDYRTDRIVDFSVQDDTIVVSLTAAPFGTTPRMFAPEAFASNTTGRAERYENRIVYNSETGGLYYYDDSGFWSLGKLIATLPVHLSLTSSDFLWT